MNDAALMVLTNLVLGMLDDKDLPQHRVVALLVKLAPRLTVVALDLADGDLELSEDNRLMIQKAIEDALEGDL